MASKLDVWIVQEIAPKFWCNIFRLLCAKRAKIDTKSPNSFILIRQLLEIIISALLCARAVLKFDIKNKKVIKNKHLLVLK